MPQDTKLSQYQRDAYSRIIQTGEAAMARWSRSNPLYARIEANVADARAKLGASA